jgi:hypothetical protein
MPTPRPSREQRHAELLARLRARQAGQHAADHAMNWSPRNWANFSRAERRGFLEGIADALDAYAAGTQSAEP